MIFFHKKLHRHTLVDESCYRVRVVGRADDHADPIFCQPLNGSGHRRSLAHNDAAGVHLNGTQLGFVAVSQNYQIIFFNIIFHQIRVRCCNDHFSRGKISMLISYNHGAVQSL